MFEETGDPGAGAAPSSPAENSSIAPPAPSEPAPPAAETSSTVPETQPGTPPPEAAPAAATPPAAEAPIDLSDEEVKQLPQRANEAFARFRTENTRLTGEVTALNQQLADMQAAPAIRLDAPADEWDVASQLRALPEPYYVRLAETVTDYHIPDRLAKVLSEDYENLPQDRQIAIAQAFATKMERETGMPMAEIGQALAAWRQQRAGDPLGTQPAMGSANQAPLDYVRELAERHNFALDDPVIQEIGQREHIYNSRLAQMQNRISQLEGVMGKAQAGVQQNTEQQATAQKQARQERFNTQIAAVQKSVFDPIRQAIPKGYERSFDFIEARVLREMDGDETARVALATAQTALERAAKYEAQGTPDFAEREMRRYTGEIGKYNTLLARHAQAEWQYMQGNLIAENVNLKNRVTDQQNGRQQLPAGNAAYNQQSGRPVRQEGEPMDDYLQRAKKYMYQRADEVLTRR